ncbi:MAG TPA: radical SAM protein, partial [Armatimonadota bacterium]|nr:radical SAM protein [Armatimonadota bacterium]
MIVDITWVDRFVRSISEYIYVRERDSLLILLPNQAYKLNPAGLKLLKSTLDGLSIIDVLESRQPGLSKDEQVLKDIHNFFCDVRALVMGCLGEGSGRAAVEEAPFERPHNSLPVLSEIALTYKCNLSCKFCYAGCRCKAEGQPNNPKASYEMTTDEVKRILDIIRYDAEVPSVSWTGGEPTLRDDLVELTEYASHLKMRVNLITNGTNLNRGLVNRLKDAGLRSAQVSLEGPDDEIHDKLTQVTGSFKRTCEGIMLLKEAGLHVHTNTTVNRINSSCLPQIIKLAKELGMDRFSMNMVIPCGSAPDQEVTITYTEMAKLIDSAKQAARREG